MRTGRYSYASSVKSALSDELINTYLIRPLAGLMVWALYYTRVTPNHLTIASLGAGMAAAYMYAQGTPSDTIVAGLLVSLKDILDSADGQLARAKQQYSRFGRFLDAVGDVIVNLLVFGAIGYALFVQTGSITFPALALLAFLGTTLRVSYHVFYHTAFLHLQSSYTVNRLTEEIREEDLRAGRATLTLQRVYQAVYGWQDRCVARLDTWCRGELREKEKRDLLWYGDVLALRLSGLMGMGTELAILTLFSLATRLETYLLFNIIVGNMVGLASLAYRRLILRRRINRVVRLRA